ncbi:trypsin-like serine peptidase [Streptomyces sp. NPDC090442]|uniref:trypsin-like serine peptidase n=1 Tax=Streptomyces sp. NPDC090442 TaxID=3365962 RepID=UPI003812E672
MDGGSRSPVGTGPERVFSDLRAVAARVRERLSWEEPDPLAGLPADELPAGRIGQCARQERARVLAAGASGLEKLAAGRAEEIGDDESFGVEAVVLSEGRPALLVERQDFAPQQGDWAVLESQRAAIRESLARVGRVAVSGHVDLDWLGAGFLVGPETVMTNRHVAAEFARCAGDGWGFQPGLRAALVLGEGRGSGAEPADDEPSYEVTEVLGVHEEVDLALLRIAPYLGGPALPAPLAIAADAPADLPGHPVYCIGYPAWDGRRGEPESIRRIFMDVYNVKRLQPGMSTGLASEGNVMCHDCSTLGGNSGSPVIDLTDHRVLGLQIGGRYGVGNCAVPLWQLVEDPLLVRAEVNFV